MFSKLIYFAENQSIVISQKVNKFLLHEPFSAVFLLLALTQPALASTCCIDVREVMECFRGVGDTAV